MKKENNNIFYVITVIAIIGGLMWSGILPGWNANAEYLNKGGVVKEFACIERVLSGDGYKDKAIPEAGCIRNYETFQNQGICELQSGTINAVTSSAQMGDFDYDVVCNTGTAKWFYNLDEINGVNA